MTDIENLLAGTSIQTIYHRVVVSTALAPIIYTRLQRQKSKHPPKNNRFRSLFLLETPNPFPFDPAHAHQNPSPNPTPSQ